MNVANTELIHLKQGIRLLKATTKCGNIVYYVTGKCPTRIFNDYDDALEHYNLQWMNIEFGNK